MNRILEAAALAALTAGLAACGGGGSDGNTYQLTTTVAPAGTATFPLNGVSAKVSNTTSVLTQNGTTVANGVDETFFDAGYHVIGDRTSVSGMATTCTLVAAGSASVPPAAASVGASGPLDSTQDLGSCGFAAPVSGSGTEAWEVQQVGGVLYFCTKSVDTSDETTTETDCVQTDADGNLGSSATLTVVYSSGLTINLSN